MSRKRLTNLNGLSKLKNLKILVVSLMLWYVHINHLIFIAYQGSRKQIDLWFVVFFVNVGKFDVFGRMILFLSDMKAILILANSCTILFCLKTMKKMIAIGQSIGFARQFTGFTKIGKFRGEFCFVEELNKNEIRLIYLIIAFILMKWIGVWKSIDIYWSIGNGSTEFDNFGCKIFDI